MSNAKKQASRSVIAQRVLDGISDERSVGLILSEADLDVLIDALDWAYDLYRANSEFDNQLRISLLDGFFKLKEEAF